MAFGLRQKPDMRVRLIRVSEIVPNPNQPRQALHPEELEELASSIRSYGVLQPILVRPRGRRFELVAGERRLRAAQLAGLERIPAVVQELKERESALLAIVENVQRQNLSVLEEAGALRRLLDEFGLTQEELAQRIGRSQAGVANKLRLLKLDRRVWDLGGLSERHLRALLALKSADVQVQFAQAAVSEGLTVRALETRIEKWLAQQETAPRKRRAPALRDVRIFLNGFRQAVKTLREAGVAAEMEETDKDRFLEVRVRIPKEKQ